MTDNEIISIELKISDSEENNNINNNNVINNSLNENLVDANKIINKDELLKEKSYYKLLLSDYKKFLKKINFQISNTETTYEKSNFLKKDKTTIYNIVEMHNSLYKNIKNIKKSLYHVSEKYNDEILILDGENILKSSKFQQLIKLFISNEEFTKFFYCWFNGGEKGVIQPMTSLNINVKDKIYLLNILLENYLSDYNCIVIITSKTNLDNDDKNFYFINKNLIIPIVYNKEDIREQDDHILLYIYFHLSKIKNCRVISGDKFKWFDNNSISIKNFKLEYDFNNLKVNLKIVNAYTNDNMIYKNYKYQIGYFYFPFLKNISKIKDLNIEDDFFNSKELYINNFIQNISNQDYESILNYTIKIYLILIELNYLKNDDVIQSYASFFINLISKIIIECKNSLENIILILNRVSSISKKAFDKIEKYNSSLLYKIIFDYDNDLSNFSSLSVDLMDFSKNNNLENVVDNKEYKKLKKSIELYTFLSEYYLIIKTLTFLLNSNKYIIKISKLFSHLIEVFDKIENNIYKIRKISNGVNPFNNLFLKILSHHIFIKKNGFCKKDF